MFSWNTTVDEYQVTLFGLKMRFYRNSTRSFFRWRSKLEKVMQLTPSMVALHRETFSKYKNCHQGRDVVIVGTGPTLSDYIPIKNAIHIGVNSAVLFDKVTMNFLFVHDKVAFDKCSAEILNGKGRKFFGITGEKNIISDQYLEGIDCERYYVDSQMYFKDFPYDISNAFLADYSTVIFSALQFALWTNPERIYLVGCDCTEFGYFDQSEKKSKSNIKNWKIGWEKFKNFQESYYPKTQIVSIRPIGLKDLFNEVAND